MPRRPRLDRELARYLVAGETTIVAVRRHWFSLIREILIACGATLLALWVDINVPHYGMHGTPSPNLVGHAQSHGCVRLTNWDAARLAAFVRPGTRVVFTE